MTRQKLVRALKARIARASSSLESAATKAAQKTARAVAKVEVRAARLVANADEKAVKAVAKAQAQVQQVKTRFRAKARLTLGAAKRRSAERAKHKAQQAQARAAHRRAKQLESSKLVLLARSRRATKQRDLFDATFAFVRELLAVGSTVNTASIAAGSILKQARLEDPTRYKFQLVHGAIRRDWSMRNASNDFVAQRNTKYDRMGKWELSDPSLRNAAEPG